MKIKQNTLLALSTMGLLLPISSEAGRQGVSAYYGVGLGVIAPTDKARDPDATLGGGFTVGVEEDGWALEINGIKGMSAGTKVSTVDYSLQGMNMGLAYRTIERNSSYYKLKFSQTDLDINYTGSGEDNTTGKTYTIGYGLRMARQERLEFDYGFHKSDNFDDPVHMLSVSYLWGGAPMDGPYHNWDGFGSSDASNDPFTIGLFAGQIGTKNDGFDDTTAQGLSLRYDLSDTVEKGLSVEFIYATLSDGDAYPYDPTDPSDKDFPDTYSGDLMGLFASYQSMGRVYVKGKLGYVTSTLDYQLYDFAGPDPDTGADTFEAAEKGKLKDSGIAYGVGVGTAMGAWRFELDYTVAKLKEQGTTFDLDMITLGALYNFDAAGMGGGSYSRSGPFTVGLIGAQVSPDISPDIDDTTAIGVSFRYALDNMAKGMSVELNHLSLNDGDSYAYDATDPLDIDYPDEYSGSMTGLYLAYSTPNQVYLKAKLGFVSASAEDDSYDVDTFDPATGTFTYVLDETIKLSDTGISYGIGIGATMGQFSTELEFTQTKLKDGIDFDIDVISLGLLYNF